jgi:bacteriocin leader peptide (microcyclamide/patellamide family)
MNNKSITPNPQQPVDRVPTGQLPNALAELSEAALDGDGRRGTVYPFGHGMCGTEDGENWEMCGFCSYDGDDE